MPRTAGYFAAGGRSSRPPGFIEAGGPVNAAFHASRIEDPAGGTAVALGKDMQLDTLRSYLQQTARLPLLQPDEELDLCRQIEDAHRALAAELLTIPSPARRLREQCATVSGVRIADDRPMGARDIIDALGRLERVRCKAAVRVHVEAAVADRRVNRENRPTLLASIERAQSDMPLRSMFVEELAADVVASSEGDDVQRVARRLEQLRDLKWRLTEANLAIVVSIAARYRHGDVPLLTLVQEGNRGLRKAVDRFECQRGVEFSTYATWWIRQTIRAAVSRLRRPEKKATDRMTDPDQ
jgi:DNA-directed RNA polymerase sigma subunit (sigma70/sigma32)